MFLVTAFITAKEVTSQADRETEGDTDRQRKRPQTKQLKQRLTFSWL